MILDEILRRTEKRVARLPVSFPDPGTERHHSMETAIRQRNGTTAIIAEIKCASPSSGMIRRNVDMEMMAGVLETAGCTALSILTEPYFFGGALRDLEKVKRAVDVPVLRKDFIIDERQIGETRALGADAILLIASILKERLPAFVDTSLEAGLEPLVEIRNGAEAELALATRARLIGINNRDLTTLGIDRATTRLLSDRIRAGKKTIVAESGMRTADDIREMRPYCDAFLIGSSIMSHDHPGKKLEELLCA